MKTLSIIIPHKNAVHLLGRCINSIPERKDVEVIIVDDNSDNIDVDSFPGVKRQDCIIVFSGRNLTAGGARNIGLEKSKGKWTLFADADDFFHPNFMDVLTHYFDSAYELIYFGMDSVHSKTFKKMNRASNNVELLRKAEKGNIKAMDTIRYKFLYPSCKLIKSSFIKKNKIKFDEVVASNDTMFGVKVGTLANNIAFSSNVIYCLTYRENSLVNTYNYATLRSRFLVSLNLNDFLEKHKKEEYAQSVLSHWLKIRKIGYVKMLSDLPILIKRYSAKGFMRDIKNAISHRI